MTSTSQRRRAQRKKAAAAAKRTQYDPRKSKLATALKNDLGEPNPYRSLEYNPMSGHYWVKLGSPEMHATLEGAMEARDAKEKEWKA